MGILRWRVRFGSVGTIQTHTRARARAYTLPPDHRPPIPRPESVLQRGIGFHLNKETHNIDGNLQLKYFSFLDRNVYVRFYSRRNTETS